MQYDAFKTGLLKVRTLPVRLIQGIRPMIRGVALEGEKPLLQLTPWHLLSTALAELGCSVVATHWILNLDSAVALPLLIPTLALGQMSVWSLYMCAHMANHNEFSPNKQVNALVAEVISTLILTLPRKKYQKTHGKHHDDQKLATPEDPDGKWWIGWFPPGSPMSAYWRRYWQTMFTPPYYLVLNWIRLKANFWTAPTYRIAMSVSWWLCVGILATHFQLWPTIILGYLIPVLLGYPLSTLLQMSEHRWLTQDSEKTFPRLLDLSLPKGRHPWQWARYSLRLVFYIFYSQAALFSLHQHQIHHAPGRDRNWAMHAWSEQAQRDLPKARWGFRAHLREIFVSLSQAKPND